MKKTVNIHEVGPRDGFQNLKEYIPLEEKIEIIDRIIATGIKHIQITSLVSPKAIPQMKDAREVAEQCLKKYPDIDLYVLIPNLYGAKSAYEIGIKKVSNVISLSQSHNKANINRTHEESLDELKKIKENYPSLEVIVDVATTFGCPFEGKFSIDQILNFIKRLYQLGIRTFNLCDTVGVANPDQTKDIIKAVKEVFVDCNFQAHFHDTRNNGIVNSIAAIECGIYDIQTTLGGLGGCPFAPGASGNTATEDLAYLLNDMGYSTGIDIKELIVLSKYQYSKIAGNYSGHQLYIK
ncbi:MAG: hydroxymethylglutaryl-CoA lyase [Fusobacteriaceae bacterium]|jgi:hydroxymethylglutaryl-CoA lyase|nr:hydroxymethylglutaryl-CoA lyase [Fusobacteriaceae bacterium]